MRERDGASQQHMAPADYSQQQPAANVNFSVSAEKMQHSSSWGEAYNTKKHLWTRMTG